MSERLVKDPKNFGSYLFWVPRPDNDISQMEKITEMGKFTIKSSQGKMLSHTHANLMLHTIDRYIRDYNLDTNALLEFTTYDLAVNGLGYNYLNLGYVKLKEDEDENTDEKKGINRYIFEKLKEIREIGIEFRGKFFEESKITKKSYGIYNSVDMDEKTGKVKIQFNDLFTKQLKATKDYVLLDIEEFRALRPKSASLYQYAIENAQDKPVEKDIRELCEDDLHWTSQKPGKLYGYFKESADEIIAKTDKVLEHNYDPKEKNVKFKIGKKNNLISAILNPEIKAIYQNCPHVIQKHPKCGSVINEYYEKYNKANNQKEAGFSWGYIIVMANLLYVIEKMVNGKVKKEGAWNYYLSCLEHNYGEKFIPIVTEKKDNKINKIEVLMNEVREEETKKKNLINKYYIDTYNSLSEEKKKEIDSRSADYADNNSLFDKESEHHQLYVKGFCRQLVMEELGYKYK